MQLFVSLANLRPFARCFIAPMGLPDTCAVVPIAQEFGLPIATQDLTFQPHHHCAPRLIPKAFAHYIKSLLVAFHCAVTRGCWCLFEKIAACLQRRYASYPTQKPLGKPLVCQSLVATYFSWVITIQLRIPFFYFKLSPLRQTVSGYDIKLLMVGEGPLKNKVESTLRKLDY